MTLLELVLALAGTAVVGAAVAALVSAVSYGSSADKDLRSLVVRQMALRARLEAEVRASRMVLDQGTNYLVLWRDDADASGTPNKNELRVIELDTANARLMRYAPAAGVADIAYDLSDDFRLETNAYKGNATFPGERWADGVGSFDLSLDDADPQQARLVAFRIGLTAGDVPDTMIGAAALRVELSE